MRLLRSNAFQLPLHFLIAFVIALLVKVENFRLILDGELINPDSYMRLVRIQEALSNGFWFENIVTRNESGMGTLIYWSHFVDGFILLLRLPLMCFMPPEEALFWAGALLGPILLGLLGMVCAWAVTPWVNKQWATLIAVTVAISVPLLNYGQIGVATHHLMIVIWVVMGWGLVARSYLDFSPISGMAAGVTAGLAIWVSPEATPYCLLGFGGILFLNLLEDSNYVHQRAVFTNLTSACIDSALYGVGFLFTVAFALTIDPPYQGILSPQLDRVSVTFLTLALFMLMASLVPALLIKLDCSHTKQVLLIPSAALLGLAAWLYLFPAYLRGLNGLMSPEEARAFFITTEMSPINSVELFLYFGLTGIFSFLVVIWLALNQIKPRLRLALAYLSVGVLVSICLAFWHVRFAIYSAAISAMALGVLLSRLSDRDELKKQTLRAIVIFAFLILPAVLDFAYKAIISANEVAKHDPLLAPIAPLNCSLKDAVNIITPLGEVIVLAEANIGPALLYRTQAKIVGSFYHAGIKGYMRLNAAWSSADSQKVPFEVRATKAQYILICPVNRPSQLATLDANLSPENPSSSLWDRLNSGRVPAWLKEVSSSTSSGWVLYQIQHNH